MPSTYPPRLFLDNLRAAARPLLRGDDLAAVRQRQDVGEPRKRIRLRLIIVGVVRILLVAARAWPQRRDAELFHHLPVVFGGGPVLRLGRGSLLSVR